MPETRTAAKTRLVEMDPYCKIFRAATCFFFFSHWTSLFCGLFTGLQSLHKTLLCVTCISVRHSDTQLNNEAFVVVRTQLSLNYLVFLDDLQCYNITPKAAGHTFIIGCPLRRSHALSCFNQS